VLSDFLMKIVAFMT